MNDLDKMQQRIGEWGNRTFPHSSPATILAHLTDEIGELNDAWTNLRFDDMEDAEEAADCLLLLLHYAHRRGFSLFDAAVVKAAINEQRVWQTEKNEHGYFGHVKEDATA